MNNPNLFTLNQNIISNFDYLIFLVIPDVNKASQVKVCIVCSSLSIVRKYLVMQNIVAIPYATLLLICHFIV